MVQGLFATDRLHDVVGCPAEIVNRLNILSVWKAAVVEAAPRRANELRKRRRCLVGLTIPSAGWDADQGVGVDVLAVGEFLHCKDGHSHAAVPSICGSEKRSVHSVKHLPNEAAHFDAIDRAASCKGYHVALGAFSDGIKNAG